MDDVEYLQQLSSSGRNAALENNLSGVVTTFSKLRWFARQLYLSSDDPVLRRRAAVVEEMSRRLVENMFSLQKNIGRKEEVAMQHQADAIDCRARKLRS